MFHNIVILIVKREKDFSVEGEVRKLINTDPRLQHITQGVVFMKLSVLFKMNPKNSY